MHRVILVGSPRPGGRSAHLADELFNACIEECPEDGVSIVSVASADVSPCCACDACAHVSDELSAAMEEGDPLTPCRFVSESDAAAHRCVIADDMPEVRKHLDAADELMVVAPVYFSGSCAQMKALLDRMQPYFWSNARRMGKRPMVLHVVGEGGDPHGFEPLIGEVRSAFGVAGFELELVLDWVGKIDAQGEIFAEADEYPIPPKGGFASLELPGGFEFAEADDADDAEAADAASVGATDETDGAGGGRCDFDGSGAALHREPAEETRFAKRGSPASRFPMRSLRARSRRRVEALRKVARVLREARAAVSAIAVASRKAQAEARAANRKA